MLFDDTETCKALRRIASHWTVDAALLKDLLQESRIRLWRLETETPGRTHSWYLQNCRFHLQHYLAAGRSVDSPKRAYGDKRISIEADTEELPADWYHTNGELIETVIARDLVSTLCSRLDPRECAVLTGLAEGRALQEIAEGLQLSYPTVLMSRRKIARLAVSLGIAAPSRRAKANGHAACKTKGGGLRHLAEDDDATKLRKVLPGVFQARPLCLAAGPARTILKPKGGETK